MSLFNYYILKELKESGKMNRIDENQYYKPEPICEDLTGTPLGFKGTITAFLVMISGNF